MISLAQGRLFAVQLKMLSFLYTALYLALLVLLWQKGKIFDLWVKTSLQQFCAKVDEPLQQELIWLQSLISGLKSGQSLDEILEVQRRSRQYPPLIQGEINALLNEGRCHSLAGSIIKYSLKSGSPCIPSLQALRLQNFLQLKSQRRMKALTLQAQTQAWLVAIIPWLLLSGMFFIDSHISQIALAQKLTWVLWVLALVLDYCAIRWLKRIADKAFAAETPNQRRNEEELLPFLMEVQALLAAGNDIESAILESAPKTAPHLQKYFIYLEQEAGEEISRETRVARSLLLQGLKFGTAISTELRSLAEDIQNQRECRWESALQLIPIRSLAPLFLCAFPASLIIIASFMGPILSDL